VEVFIVVVYVWVLIREKIKHAQYVQNNTRELKKLALDLAQIKIEQVLNIMVKILIINILKEKC